MVISAFITLFTCLWIYRTPPLCMTDFVKATLTSEYLMKLSRFLFQVSMWTNQKCGNTVCQYHEDQSELKKQTTCCIALYIL